MLNLKRLALLIKNDIMMHRHTVYIVIGTIIGILLLFNLISPHNIYTINTDPTAMLWILFLGGIWVTSLTFRELYDKEKNYLFLLLPCSNLEKLLNKLILTAIIYPLVVVILYTAFYWLIAIFTKLLYHFTPALFDPFQATIWLNVASYIVIQSVFFLGAIYFKSHPIIKTFLCLIILGIIISIFTFITGIFLFKSLFVHGIFFLPNFRTLITPVEKSLADVIHITFWIVLAPTCWIISYLRLKEFEVA